jgi:hypothetical protein
VNKPEQPQHTRECFTAGCGGRNSATRIKREKQEEKWFLPRKRLKSGGWRLIDPFTYTVHALRNLTLKDTGIEGIYRDVLVLIGFSVVMIAGIIALFKRQV